MDNHYARAYMNERMEDAERRRLVVAVTRTHGRPPMLARLWRAISTHERRSRPAQTALVVVAADCGELDCCAA